MKNSKKYEEHEQYDRRLCLRIKGSTKKTKEDANDILNQVRNLFKEADVEILDAVLNNDVIIRFTTLDIEYCSIITVKK